jgi:outer membrane lipopolysaccharide assembly protein LptE/RlpB
MKKIINTTLLLSVVICITSCGINRGLTNAQVEQRNNIDYELDKLYLEYSYQRDSLIMEFYNIK